MTYIDFRSVLPLHGYAGPCAGTGCKLAAEVKVVIDANGVEAFTWVCDRHLTSIRNLIRPASEAALTTEAAPRPLTPKSPVSESGSGVVCRPTEGKPE